MESGLFINGVLIEIYHNTPETQTDESYNHPEDIEHFSQHEAIEKQEIIKEAKFQGISVEEAQAAHDAHEHEGSTETPSEEHVVEDPHSQLLSIFPHYFNNNLSSIRPFW